jgi:hypothetical protein
MLEPNTMHISWYVRVNLWGNIQLPHSRQYKLGDFLAVRKLKRDEIIHKDEDDEIWVDPAEQSSGRIRPGDGSHTDDGKAEEVTRGVEKATGKWKGARDGMGKLKVTEDG